MKPAPTMVLLSVLALLGEAPAVAQTAETQETTSKASGARVRATHRVDVIAPGERVETIIDRMRANRPPTEPEKPLERPPLRGLDQGREQDKGREPDKSRAPDKGREQDHRLPESRRGPGSSQPPNTAPPPDRRHR